MAITTAAALIGSALIGAGSAAYSANQQKKAASQAIDAAKGSKVDIGALNAQTVQQSIDNARRSAALEQELNPEAAALRRNSLNAVLGQLGTDPYTAAVRAAFAEELTKTPEGIRDSALSSAARQRALADLNIGGDIPLDVANQIVRSSAAKAAKVGGGRLGLGRDLSARDLGLTSLDLRNQRLATAATLGQQEDAAALDRANFSEAQRQARYQLGLGLASLGQSDFNRALQAAQLGQMIEQPMVGLDPSAVANIAVGNSNTVANAGQQAAAIRAQRANTIASGIGNLGGLGLSYAMMPTVSSGLKLPAGSTITGSGGAPARLPSMGGFYGMG
jgi:hypothetical protein